MKKYKIILLAVLGLLSSCDKFLEEAPKGNITETYLQTEDGVKSLILSLYQSNRNLINDMMYFVDGGTDLVTYATNGSGSIFENGSQYNDVSTISYSYNSHFWKYAYNSLNLANMAIEDVVTAKISKEETRSQLNAESHGLRAYYLYLLVETYGPGAHYSVKSTTSVSTEGYQPGIATFYKTIIEDLEVAIKGLKTPTETNQWGRMNIGVAKALKTRVLMSLAAYDDNILSEVGYTKEKCYSETIELCNSVINDYGYKLLDNYTSVFDVKNQINNEIIWSIQYTSDLKYNGITSNDANYLHRYLVPWYNKSIKTPTVGIDGLWSHSRVYGREYRTMMPTYFYISSFNKYDKRRDGTFQTVWCRIPNDWNSDPIVTDTLLIRSLDPVSQEKMKKFKARGICLDDITEVYDQTTKKPTVNGRSCYNTIKKYLDPSRDAAKREEGFKDVILIRLGEIYNILAEAYFRKGQNDKAAETINALRKRALTPGFEDQLKVSASDITIDFILDEDARESGVELNRWFVLKRSGKLIDRVSRLNPDIANKIQAHHIYRPLPLESLYEVTNLDKFVQNSGY